MASGLYDWQQPGLPEDLSLLRPNGVPVLVTIAHEGDAYLDVTEEEYERLGKTVPGLEEMLDPDRSR